MSLDAQNPTQLGQTYPKCSALRVVGIPLTDRCQICNHFQELTIPCQCSGDGSLRIVVQTPSSAAIVSNLVQQFILGGMSLNTPKDWEA
ncbi:MAG: Asr1405/Asl0597 family protein [Microcoleaceae cyanobacterium]